MCFCVSAVCKCLTCHKALHSKYNRRRLLVIEINWSPQVYVHLLSERVKVILLLSMPAALFFLWAPINYVTNT